MRNLRSLLAGSVAAISCLSPAMAQDGTIQLEEVVVEGVGTGQAAGTGPVNGVVPSATLTGSKTATDITEVPQSVSVVGREEIDDQGAQNVGEALRYTPGVLTQPFGTDADTNWLWIRGFQATQTGTYLDGLQNFSYAFGNFYVDTFGLERIDVLKGPASVLYGGSNPGGIVNYVSKRPDFTNSRYLEGGINDAGTGYVGFDVSATSNEAVAMRINGRLQGGEGYSDFQKGWRGFVAPSITWKPDEQTTFTLLANYTHVDERHNGDSFLPYFGTVVDRVVGGVNYGKIDRDANFSEPSVDFYERNQASLGYEFEHTFDNEWTVRSLARYGVADIGEQFLYANGWAQDTYGDPTLSPTALARVNFSQDTRVSTFLWDNQVEGTFNTGAIEHRLLAGVDYKYFNIDQNQRSAVFGTTPNIDAFNPVYGAPLTDPVSYLNQDLTQQQLGLYVQDQLRFADGWLVTLNGRYDFGWLEAKDRPNFYAPTLNSEQDRSDGSLSGRAGIAYEFDNGLTPYVSAATFFNPIIGTDANGDLFEPEEGVQYEAGIKYAPTFIDGLFTLSVFDLTRQNVPTNVTAFTQIQTGEVRSRGIELEGKINVTEDFKVTAALTAYDIDVTKDENPALIGKTPFIVPEVLASVWGDYTFRAPDSWYDGISLGAGVRYLGSSWADNENTLKVPDATLVDVKIGYERANWAVDLNVTNLFDEEFVSSCQGITTCSYGEGRSFKLKASTTW